MRVVYSRTVPVKRRYDDAVAAAYVLFKTAIKKEYLVCGTGTFFLPITKIQELRYSKRMWYNMSI